MWSDSRRQTRCNKLILKYKQCQVDRWAMTSPIAVYGVLVTVKSSKIFQHSTTYGIFFRRERFYQ